MNRRLAVWCVVLLAAPGLSCGRRDLLLVTIVPDPVTATGFVPSPGRPPSPQTFILARWTLLLENAGEREVRVTRIEREIVIPETGERVGPAAMTAAASSGVLSQLLSAGEQRRVPDALSLPSRSRAELRVYVSYETSSGSTNTVMTAVPVVRSGG